MTALAQAADQRIRVINNTNPEHRSIFAQHLTPPETAALAASLFSDAPDPISCLDLGAGTGILTTALLQRYGNAIRCVDAIEIDPILSNVFNEEVRERAQGITITGDALVETPSNRYDRIILNPPYKKMAAKDPRQRLLPVKAPNLYSAFLSVALTRLARNGEAVAIVPRSWMNGDYFKPFRIWALSNFSLDAIHVYGSRTEIFKDTSVLQETMLVRFSNRSQVGRILVSRSENKTERITHSDYSVSDLVDPVNKTVRIAPQGKKSYPTISSIGLCPSTGKVVDFRSRDLLAYEKPEGIETYPLIYSGNFRLGVLEHPAEIGKAQWFNPTNERERKRVIQPGFYVVVKRFSSKEETRRVVAYPLFLETPAALENHTNYLHQGTSRCTISLRSKNLAQGISLWLNSTFIDEWFRDMSGSTQVNAGDIKQMPTPTIDQLEELGMRWEPKLKQSEIDDRCKEYQ